MRPNGFVTDTEWLPRADHFLFGQSLLFDRLTWHEHTQRRLRPHADRRPPRPTRRRSPSSARCPGKPNVEGVRAATRHEIDLPLEAGPDEVVPYVLGEAAYWGEDLSGEDAHADLRPGRREGQPADLAGRSDRQSELFNLNGLAHKVTFEARVPVCRRQRGPGRPAALRPARRQRHRVHAAGRWRSARSASRWARSCRCGSTSGSSPCGATCKAPSASPTEIADDLMEFRMGLNQRWQTKRGLAGQQRIIDWIVLDIGAVLFPDSARDNFGEALGLVDYDFRWHVGDRLTLLSDGFFDVFDRGPAAGHRRRAHQPAGARQLFMSASARPKGRSPATFSPARSATA